MTVPILLGEDELFTLPHQFLVDSPGIQGMDNKWTTDIETEKFS
jgi:hypothetical protein